MMFADVIDRRVDLRHRQHHAALAFVAADDTHHANDVAMCVAHRQLVRDEPVQHALLVVPQLNAADERLTGAHHMLVVPLEVIGGVRRKEVIVHLADDLRFGLCPQVLPKRLTGADHSALPILHKKVRIRKMFEKLLKLLMTTHALKKYSLKLMLEE